MNKKLERIPLEDTESFLKETVQDEEANLNYYKKKLEILSRIKEIVAKKNNGGKLTEKEIREAMAITCYGNIAYCCGVSKQCPFRDAALTVLGIDLNTYRRMKEEMMQEILKKIGII
ncbi:hypothetical protein [Candidatus Methanodesulfokora washburnensis]|jgi:predicted metal-binding transcription factor (methanogenesis marker protein 9)|uniref:Uncharacterized protein n=1 Tax=Candidatus Methanodesulfokora washburnensis TaxID=2478471 RepID=A0A429GFD9_9CREN|nr:hypothetical protein [Candidatus Methanodesulfokores washburnensis]RSN72460.1 hypothetical protein D6D85_13700 [Candidatus Methanodesulfokores washburnensis]